MSPLRLDCSESPSLKYLRRGCFVCQQKLYLCFSNLSSILYDVFPMNSSETIIQEDLKWFSQIRAGDQKAFRRLFDRYYSSLCRFLYVYFDEKEVIEEIVLDLFTHIWNHRSDIQVQLTVKAYLFQAVRNRGLNHLRTIRPKVTLDDSYHQIADDNGSCSLEFEELNILVEEAILALPEKCKQVFEKSRIEEMSNQEIASSMGITVKAVEAHITKALKRIKVHLENQYHYLW